MWYLTVFLILIGHLSNADEVYQYKDGKGNVVIGNRPKGVAQKINLPPLTIYSTPSTANSYKELPQNSYPYPGVNETGRRKILTEELNKEQEALKNTIDLLKQTKSIKFRDESKGAKQYQLRIKLLRDAISEYQKNIAILHKQLN